MSRLPMPWSLGVMVFDEFAPAFRKTFLSEYDAIVVNASSALFDGVYAVRQTHDLVPGLHRLSVFATFLKASAEVARWIPEAGSV
jgi:hypothetical protein